MARTGKYFDTLESVFGKNMVTSGYRSQAEQDALVARGVTKATKSSHTTGTGYDLAIGAAESEDQIRSRLGAQGLTARRVIRETGKGKNQGTGAHWHIELEDGSMANGAAGGYNASQPGRGVADPSEFLRGLETSLKPEKAASQNVKQNASAIYGSDEKLKAGQDAVDSRLGEQAQQLDVLGQAMQAAHTAQTEAMTRQVNSTKDVSNEIVKGTRELADKVKPVFEARGRIADQLDRINTMNPLERGLRGIFDLNYDKDYLEGQLANYDRTLKARSDDYNYINTLHERALQEINRNYQTDTALPGLMQEQAKEDLGLVGMRLTQTSQVLDAMKDRAQTETQLISAKAIAREDLLSRLDLPTISNLMTQAEQAGGVVKFNGVEFSGHELRTRLQVAEKQELDTEAYRMSIAANRMDMAEKYAVNLARSLTRGQLEAAINNGGVYNGIQLPQDLLTSLFGGAVQRDTLRAETIANNLPTKVAFQAGVDSMRALTGLYERGKTIVGGPMQAGATPYLTRGGQLIRDLQKAADAGAPPEVITALTQQIATNTKSFQDYVDNQLLLKVGNDKRAAGYLRGFMYGAPLSQGTAAEAITYFAVKGSLPEGVALSPESKQVFQKSQALVKAYRDANAGKKLTEQQIVSAVTPQLVEAASTIMGAARFDKLYADLPGVASSAGHPFGKFDRQRWANIRSQAQSNAADAVAGELSTTSQNVLTMARTGKPLSSSESDKQLYDAWVQNQSKFNSVEIDTTTKLLDMEDQVVKGQDNSDVLSDFLGSANFATGVRSYGQSLGSQSMGEYLANPLQAGAVEQNFNLTRQAVQDARSAQYVTRRQFAQNPASSQLFKPVSRTSMILEAIPGVGVEGRKALQPFVTEFFQQKYKSMERGGLESPNARFMREDAALRDALQAAQFPDRRLDNYRKMAVKSWDEHATQQQGFIQRLTESIFGSSF